MPPLDHVRTAEDLSAVSITSPRSMICPSLALTALSTPYFFPVPVPSRRVRRTTETSSAADHPAAAITIAIHARPRTNPVRIIHHLSSCSVLQLRSDHNLMGASWMRSRRKGIDIFGSEIPEIQKSFKPLKNRKRGVQVEFPADLVCRGR